MTGPLAATSATASELVAERWWLRPRVVLPTVVLVLLISILLTPRQETDSDPRLTTYSANPTGARGMYDILARLGWQVSRRTTRLDTQLDTGAVYAILAPQVPLDSAERIALLRMVQAGGRVLLVSRDTQFTIPFHMYARYASAKTVPIMLTSAAGDSGNVIHRDLSDNLSLSQNFGIGWKPQYIVHAQPPLDDTIAVLLWASPNRDSIAAAPLMLGRRIGRGRAVLVADPSLLWNMNVQEGHSALAVQRAIEWLAPSNRKVIFDEYHQVVKREVGPNVLGAIGHALTDTAAGRAGVQGIAAALVLLIALGVRPIPPRPVRVIQRRSLLEHVDALGRAYQQIHACHFGTQQLMRGLRRRHPTGSAVARWTATSDGDYLMAVQQRYGIAQQDIDVITRALGDIPTAPASDIMSGSSRDDLFIQAGQAIGRIEHSIHVQ